MNKFTFDSQSRLYRYASGKRTGQIVNEKAMAKLLENYMIQQRSNISTATDDVINNRISVKDWQSSLASSLKSMHINSYSLGRGGVKQIDADDMKSIKNRLKSEFNYLEKFAREIEGGSLSEAQIKNRVRLYVDAAYSQWQLGREIAAFDSGENFEIWDSAEDSCTDCSGKSQLGWQPIGALGTPGVGVRCLSQCRCNKRFGSDRNGGEVGLAVGRRDGWILGRSAVTIANFRRKPSRHIPDESS